MISKEQMAWSQMQAMEQALGSMPSMISPFQEMFARMVTPQEARLPQDQALLKSLGATAAASNAYARVYRKGGAAYQRRASEFDRDGNPQTYQAQLAKAALAKAAGPLDVGSNVNFSQISGGQSLGYVSLDTQLARGTIRPDSFALYQSLPKSQAFQIVDYWAYIDDIGGNMPATNFNGYTNVSSGTLSTVAGLYELNNITLKLAVNGRALTTALAAQNSFVDIAAQENANAALSILTDFDWACFWGNPTLYPNQPAGIYFQLTNTSGAASGNIFDFQQYANQSQYAGLTKDQILFNLIYDVASQVTKWGVFGHITHAFMSQEVVASLQSLTTTLLNNIVNVNSFSIPTGGARNLQGMTINGDIDGMFTRFGQIRFPVDIQISARDIPAQAVVFINGTSPATTSAPTPPAGVTGTVSGTTGTSDWTSAYCGSSATGVGAGCTYVYAVASTNAAMFESNLTYSAVITASAMSTTSGAISVSITPPVAADATVFRVYRSGLGYNLTTSSNIPAAFRYVGSVAASGSSNVTFLDANLHIPGSSTIFLLDLDENDKALDFRYMLPLTKIELFAQNLYMPWAVAMIGSPRVRIPKFHAVVQNFVPDNPSFNPLAPNLSATF